MKETTCISPVPASWRTGAVIAIFSGSPERTGAVIATLELPSLFPEM
jgi:hypothetical protein